MCVKHQLKELVGSAGKWLPHSLKLKLAARVPKSRYLLAKNRAFQFDHFLGDISVNIDPTNPHELEFVCGVYEPEVQKIFDEFVKPGNICFDVGANVGAISLSLCQKVGVQGKVYSFEPGPPFFQRLCENFELNPLFKSIVSLHPMGLSDQSETLRWSQDPEHPANGGFIAHEENYSIEVQTLDQVRQNLAVPKIDFIKIDTEGMELEVLNGAQETLKKDRPFVLVETLMDFDGPSQRRLQLEKNLKGLDYQLYGVTLSNLSPVCYPDFPANCFAIPRI